MPYSLLSGAITLDVAGKRGASTRTAGTAAHLVDCVLPAMPVRQYVMAFPYELSGLAATRPEVLRALSRIFWEALRRRYGRWAKRAGHPTAWRRARAGRARASTCMSTSKAL